MFTVFVERARGSAAQGMIAGCDKCAARICHNPLSSGDCRRRPQAMDSKVGSKHNMI